MCIRDRVYYDTPTMLGALDLLHDMVFEYKAMPEGVTDSKAVSSAFFAGEAGMMIDRFCLVVGKKNNTCPKNYEIMMQLCFVSSGM